MAKKKDIIEFIGVDGKPITFEFDTPKANKPTKKTNKTAEPLEPVVSEGDTGESEIGEQVVEDDEKKETTQGSVSSTKSRIRAFSLSTYIEDICALETFIKRAPWISHFAYCTHDRDTYANGERKPTHTHILLHTYNAMTVSAVRKRFNVLARSLNPDNPQNTLGKGLGDAVHMWRYLRHLDNPEKAQYEEHERVCDDYSYWYKLEKTSGMNDSSNNLGLAMLTDYMNGIHPLEFAHRYGKEGIYHYTHFQKFAYECYKHDALTNVNEQSVKEIMQLCLEGSPLPKEQILVFWNVYNYIITQLNCKYNSKIDIYLTEN